MHLCNVLVYFIKRVHVLVYMYIVQDVTLFSIIQLLTCQMYTARERNRMSTGDCVQCYLFRCDSLLKSNFSMNSVHTISSVHTTLQINTNVDCKHCSIKKHIKHEVMPLVHQYAINLSTITQCTSTLH